MAARRSLRVERPKSPPRPLAERGRILYAEDIREIYGKRPDGKYRKSLRWIWANVAPEHRYKDGRTPFWFEADVLSWLEEYRGHSA